MCTYLLQNVGICDAIKAVAGTSNAYREGSVLDVQAAYVTAVVFAANTTTVASCELPGRSVCLLR